MDSLRCSQEIEERFKAKFFNIKNTPCRHFSKISRGPRLSNSIIAKNTFMQNRLFMDVDLRAFQ